MASKSGSPVLLANLVFAAILVGIVVGLGLRSAPAGPARLTPSSEIGGVAEAPATPPPGHEEGLGAREPLPPQFEA